jgi:hypothetical protein
MLRRGSTMRTARPTRQHNIEQNNPLYELQYLLSKMGLPRDKGLYRGDAAAIEPAKRSQPH